MKKNLLKILSASLLAMTMVTLVGCGSSSTKDTKTDTTKTESTDTGNSGDTLKAIKDRGYLVIGNDSSFPPFGFKDPNNSSQAIGIDISMGKAIADELGVDLKVESMAFKAVLSSLVSNKVDLAISAVTVTDERKQTMDFSDIYLTTEDKLLVRAEDAGKYKSIDDAAGKKIAAVKASYEEKNAQKISNVQLTSLDTISDCILNLKNNKIDAVVIDSVVGKQYVVKDNTIAFSDAKLPGAEKAIALNKGNDDLKEVVNKVIKEKQASGEITKWVDEYSQKAAEIAK